jgi:hypothetical protein
MSSSTSHLKKENSEEATILTKTGPTKAFDLWWAQSGKPSETLKQQVLYLTDHYQIDPLLGDINILYQGGRWIPHITMDGWMKIINQHPAFCGIDFREASEFIDDIPEWISCTIYRNDRVIPITIREYYVELKQEGVAWSEIPRRLLRFRSMQQCARLALSLSTPEFAHQAVDYSQAFAKPPTENRGDIEKGSDIGSPNQTNLPNFTKPSMTHLEKIKAKFIQD